MISTGNKKCNYYNLVLGKQETIDILFKFIRWMISRHFLFISLDVEQYNEAMEKMKYAQDIISKVIKIIYPFRSKEKTRISMDLYLI